MSPVRRVAPVPFNVHEISTRAPVAVAWIYRRERLSLCELIKLQSTLTLGTPRLRSASRLHRSTRRGTRGPPRALSFALATRADFSRPRRWRNAAPTTSGYVLRSRVLEQRLQKGGCLTLNRGSSFPRPSRGIDSFVEDLGRMQ